MNTPLNLTSIINLKPINTPLSPKQNPPLSKGKRKAETPPAETTTPIPKKPKQQDQTPQTSQPHLIQRLIENPPTKKLKPLKPEKLQNCAEELCRAALQGHEIKALKKFMKISSQAKLALELPNLPLDSNNKLKVLEIYFAAHSDMAYLYASRQEFAQAHTYLDQIHKNTISSTQASIHILHFLFIYKHIDDNFKPQLLYKTLWKQCSSDIAQNINFDNIAYINKQIENRAYKEYPNSEFTNPDALKHLLLYIGFFQK